MVKASELITVLGVGTSVVALTIGATLYLSGETGNSIQQLSSSDSPFGEGSHRFDIGDAFFPCRDHLSNAIPYKLRNINVDSHSSRYDEQDNSHVVFIDLEVMDRPGAFYSKYSHSAHVVCRVSAANNEITSFKVRKG